MSQRYCFWSVADGPYAEMLKTTIASARAVGLFKDFHIWSDRPIDDAICHDAGQFDKTGYLFKLRFLREQVRKLKYEYFVWLDADTYFVRHPGDVLRVLRGAPFHASLEANACDPSNTRADWWHCPLSHYVRLMRRAGVQSYPVYNVNAGFWIVHREAIDTVFLLPREFWEFARNKGYAFTEEAPLAYVAHMLCGDPYRHHISESFDLWASDWTGQFEACLPDGQAWWFFDYFNGAKTPVNPAIVHAMRSKGALAAQDDRKGPAKQFGPETMNAEQNR